MSNRKKGWDQTITPEGGGVKFDAGKPRLELIPYEAERLMGHVLAYGAEKYADWNWAKGMAWSRLAGAAKRHIGKFLAGQDLDEDDPDNGDKGSGLPHIGHALVMLAMLAWMVEHRPDMDDRMPQEYREKR